MAFDCGLSADRELRGELLCARRNASAPPPRRLADDDRHAGVAAERIGS
jgi:hypothetical protein